jgi:hypothetical protein
MPRSINSADPDDSGQASESSCQAFEGNEIDEALDSAAAGTWFIEGIPSHTWSYAIERPIVSYIKCEPGYNQARRSGAGLSSPAPADKPAF